EQVSAEYSLREDGGIKVVNRGYLPKEARWKQAEGKAYFMGPENEGHLKVSFFGPFYGSYVVFGLDPASYQYAFVAGNTHDYLWLLARTPMVDPTVIEKFTRHAQQAGFATDALIFVNQKE
ncbi:MAG: lipocalin, partial [Desulfuromonas sp.]